jgi:hypothetical protein
MDPFEAARAGRNRMIPILVAHTTERARKISVKPPSFL